MVQANPSTTWGWVLLEHLRIDKAKIGILPRERRRTQPVLVHVALEVATGHIAASNSLQFGVDYRDIAQLIRQTILRQHYDLLETMAEQVSQNLWQRFPYVRRMHLQIYKPKSIPGALASVRLSRRRHNPLPVSA